MATLGSSNLIYWEGSVRAAGNRGANTVGGQGYVELTGYARPFALPR